MGGQRRLARAIIAGFPEHTADVEPFRDGAAVLFLKAPLPMGMLNDLNDERVIANFEAPRA